ncbi:MAG: ribonuclease E/G, partial [Vicinamibacterales bacterium]
MNKEMVVSSTTHETRVAILEDDQVVEIFIEREQSRGVVGNIYKGRVSKVLPGMQSAFVDLGLDRDAFLYVTDVIDPTEESLEEEEDQAPEPVPEPEGLTQDDAEATEAGESDTPKAASVAAQPAANASQNGKRGRDRERTPSTTKIEDLLKEGQEVVVQVLKEPLGTKGARITSHISLPGRFLVYMPTVNHIGVSRKIESRDERRRVRAIVQKFKDETGLPGGVIIRTAAVNRPEEDILSDLQYFQTVWTEVQRRRETQRPPAVLYREESLVAKLLRDFLTEQFTAIRIDDETEYQRVVTLVGRIMPAMAARVKKYSKDYPIFDEYGVQGEIDKALR